MEWFGFGDARPPAAENPADQVNVPLGEQCAICHIGIGPTDRGFMLPHYHENGWIDKPVHQDCLMESVLGPEWEELARGIRERREESHGRLEPPDL